MAIINNDAILSVTFDSLIYGQQILTTFHYRATEVSVGGVLMTNLFSAFRTKLGTTGGMEVSYAACFNPVMQNIKTVIQVIYPTRYVRDVQFSSFPEGTFSTGGPAMPPNTAAALVLRSELSGPGTLGTKHLPLTDFSFTENGIITEAGATVFNGLGDAAKQVIELDAPADGVIMVPVVYKKANPAGSVIINSRSLMTTARVMRRRTVGQGS